MLKNFTDAELEYRQTLKNFLKPGTTVYTIMRFVSRTGATHSVSLVAAKGGTILPLDDIMVSSGMKLTPDNKFGGFKFTVSGYDTGKIAVYDLSRALYPNGFPCLGTEKCQSPEHEEYQPIIDAKRGGGKIKNPRKNYAKGNKHTDGGFALLQEWL